MFKSKHEFTCPDVIYLRNRQKKINRWSIAINLLFFAGVWVVGDVMDKRETERLATVTDIPTE